MAVTVDSKIKTEDGMKYDFEGLSTDTKPLNTYGGEVIANGSTFMELNTHQISFYDGENNQWV